jgi:hypothetical protein
MRADIIKSRMQKSLLILLHTLLPFSNPEKAAYDVIFAGDYQSALTYIRQNSQAFKASAYTYGHSPELLTSIVFPELVRYSMISDILETTALEYIYLSGGSGAADFSIGRFQMKPSFVEQLESEIEQSDSLKSKYRKAITYQHEKEFSQRAQRLQRLKTMSWQLLYLNAFVDVVTEKFKDQHFKGTEDSLQFYASAYNGGFCRQAQQIRTSATQRLFPYGTGYDGPQYAYADVAVYFHSHVFLKKKLPKVPL